jgi:hypothetical protein
MQLGSAGKKTHSEKMLKELLFTFWLKEFTFV